jgi:hypothetical protein
MVELQKRGLCAPTYPVAACTLRAIQIALANPVKKPVGEGSLGARGTMQMLHSACDLQESVEFGEFKLTMSEASQWVQLKQADDSPVDACDPKIRDFFVNAWDRVSDFVLAPPPGNLLEPMEKTQKIAQPVLTRWWLVGVAAASMKQHHRVVLGASQICINTNNPNAKPNKIASGLQSLMMQDVACLDMLFLALFHSNFLTKDFEWPQAVDAVASRGCGCQQTWIPFPANPPPMLFDANRSRRAQNSDRQKLVWRLRHKPK